MPDSLPTDINDIVARLFGEGAIGMTQAARLCGTFRQGKPTHAGTVTRWALKGIRLADGSVLRLESFRLNGRLCTSKQAIYRFVQAQNDPTTDSSPVASTPTEYARRAKAAAKQLDDLGIK